MQVQFDGTPDGCLCAVAWALAQPQETLISIAEGPAATNDLFADPATEIPTHTAKADTFFTRLQNQGGKQAARNILRSLMVMPAGQANALLGYARLLLQHGAAVDQFHGDPDVAFIHRNARKVSHEIHRFKGLLRFQQLRGGRFMAIYDPDYDITLFLAAHFARRLGSQSWIILDQQRCCAATWNGRVLNAETPDHAMLSGAVLNQFLQTCEPDPADQEIQRQWQTFHQAVVIENRVNPTLQRRCMPARYWKHLTEMQQST